MSKFGAHIVLGSRNGYGGFCEAKPAVVLSVDDGGALLEAKQKSGGYTVTIFRQTTVYLEAPNEFNTAPDMVALARQYYPALKTKWQQNPADYYTITNEIGGNDEAVLIRLVTYEREIMRLANADGFKVCVLNLAGGSPGDIEVWKRVCMPFIIEAWQGRNVYGRHAYGSGDLIAPSGNVIIGNPSRPFEELGYLRQAGAAGGIVITEAGLDGGFGFAGVERFTRQMTGYEQLLRLHPEFIGLCGWTLGNWSEANWQDVMPAMTQYLKNNPTPKWEWPSQPAPDPDPDPAPPPSTYLHTRLVSPANIRVTPSTNLPSITPVAVKEGLELVKLGDVTGQPVNGNSAWVKTAAFISRSYVTDKPGGKVVTNRNVNLRVVPTTTGNWPLVLLPAGREFESLGNIKDLYNNGLWVAVALYIWKPLTIDVVPGIRFGKLLPGTLSVTSPFNAPRSYPFAPTKKQLHEGLDFAAPLNTPVFAGAAGVVDFVRLTDPGFGYGKTVRIKHSDRYTSWHGHLNRVDVSVGQSVAADKQIGLTGNTGGSSGAHYHWTLQDIPSGINNYVIDDVTDPTLYIHPVVSLQPGPAPEPPPGTLIDLRRFKIADPDCWRVVRSPEGNQEDVQDMELGNGLFVRRKNSLGEWHRRDNNLFYLVHDTSPAPGGEGVERVYSLYKNGQPGAPKSKVQQTIGEVWTESGTHFVQFRAKNGCRILSENSGNAQNSSVIVRYERNYRFNTYGQNLVFEEVVWEKTGVETQIYGRMNGRSCGWLGWHSPWGSSEPVEIHWDRGRMTQEPNRYCSWD